MELGYDEIGELLGDDAIGAATADDGKAVVFWRERGADGAPVHCAAWESKRGEHVVWNVVHRHHADGTVEETFEYERL